MAKNKRAGEDAEKLNFEQAIDELTALVEQIEQGQIPLQATIDKYERGMALIKRCRRILQDAEKRIEKIAEEGGKEAESAETGSEAEDEGEEEGEGDEGESKALGEGTDPNATGLF